MLLILRILLSGLFLWFVWRAREGARENLADDLGNAWNIALVIISGLAASVTWAPVLGARLADPVSGMLTDGSVLDDSNRVLRMIHWAERRRWRRLVLFLCFIEGIRHPRLPAQFVIGMNHARPGSWFEKIFATEVYKFSNVANAARAREILRLRHDADPGPHSRIEVNLALLGNERTPRAEAEVMTVAPAPPAPPLNRNQSIRLFSGAEAGDPPAASGKP